MNLQQFHEAKIKISVCIDAVKEMRILHRLIAYVKIALPKNDRMNCQSSTFLAFKGNGGSYLLLAIASKNTLSDKMLFKED